MPYIIIISITIVAVLIVGYFVHKRKAERRRRLETEKDENYQQLVAEMKVLVTIITSTPENYLDADTRKSIKTRANKVIEQVDAYRINNHYYGYEEYYVLKMAEIDISTKLNELNENFVQENLEKYYNFFSDIGGMSLDLQQRRAIVIDENHNLIIAGAGSGKTLTILGKVLYLLETGVSPNEILLIAFTKKAAGELKERIKRSISVDIKAVTFHSLGLSVIKEDNNKRPEVDSNMQTYVEDYFSKEMIKHAEEVQNFIAFMGYYFNIPFELKEDGTLGEKIDAEHHVDLETLQSKYERISQKEKKTIKGEIVKSVEELIIANFLFLNGVKYEYERAYKYPTDKYRKIYKPDFYLSDYDIYLEHFGINRNGRCPWLSKIEEEKYIDGMAWKRNLHSINNTTLIETYSYFQNEGNLIPKLGELLLENGVELKEISTSEIMRFVDEICLENTNREFIKLCMTFIQLHKTNGYAENYLSEIKKKLEDEQTKNGEYANAFITTRTLQFIKIIEKVYKYYQKRLNENNAIDFADMINMATTIVNRNGVAFPCKYIIIDEYQDIGMDRYKLVKAIIKKTSAHLMCVGDDWQSIYRFAGSDSSLITNFEKYWGETQLSKIEKTYRNSQELLNIASAFVMKNPNQITKLLRSDKSCKNPVCLYYYNDTNTWQVFDKIVSNITEQYGKNCRIALLGRTQYDINLIVEKRILNKKSDGEAEIRVLNNPNIKIVKVKEDESEKIKIIYKEKKNLDIEFLTVHKAKGLEADNVIILNMKNDKFGFPNQIGDDPVLQLLLPVADNYAFAEERRLFYVAMTRTKNQTFILVPDKNASNFANEIKGFCHIEIPEGENLIINNPICPRCKTGRLVVRQSEESKNFFVGCSHYPACDFTNNDISIIENPVICPNCGGFLVVRNGTNGQFLGCSNYPECRQTASLYDTGDKRGRGSLLNN